MQQSEALRRYLQENDTWARRKRLPTGRGPLYLQRDVKPATLELLHVDEGLRAFARRPEREYQLLLDIAAREENSLTLAYTPEGVIVGQVSLAPAGGWWLDLLHTQEVAVEVSSEWRRQGLASHLLGYALEPDAIEDQVIVGLGFSWHWDFEGLGLSRFQYRALIERLFATYGFSEYLTSEPNIRSDPANILMARIGSRVSSADYGRFISFLLRSDGLPGL